MEKVIISSDDFEDIKERILSEGADKFHVLADFDRTLTKAFINGEKCQTVIAHIRNGNYLGEDYVKKAHELFDIYHPIEIDSNIGQKLRNEKMDEWWRRHFELLIEKGINIQLMNQIVSESKIQFREGALKFIDFLDEKKIPLIIMSAGVGDMILEFLRKEGRLYDNVHVIANFYEFDESGKAIKIKEPVIHTFNKKEIEVNIPGIANRKNVLLIGDSLGDLEMVEGFDYDNLLSIGFLNENVEENLETYKELYDAVLLGDGGFGFINDFVKEFD